MYKNVSKQVLLILWSMLVIACTPQERTLTILHTNDTHSQVEPVRSGSRANQGGYARRMGVITAQRELDPDLLLMDAGDFSQGSPFFNVFHGRVEVAALNRMGYDVITLGNHEFDNGLDTLAARLQELTCPVVCANYEVSHTPLEGLVKPYVIFRRKGLKIGVLGLGINPQGLIATPNFGAIQYLDPQEVAPRVSSYLKQKKHCDLVVCLSHVGTEYRDPRTLCDVQLASIAPDVDIWIGGHTHEVVNSRQFIEQKNDSVYLVQMGKSGAKIGKISIKIRK